MFNRQIEPVQTELEWIEGSPEGVRQAPAGYFVIDFTTGNWWRKTTDATQDTGWVIIASGGATGAGILIGIGDPTGAANDGTIYINRVNGELWYYDALAVVWVGLIIGPR
jgi:hypothetical protein